MKKHILILVLLITSLGFAQKPIVDVTHYKNKTDAQRDAITIQANTTPILWNSDNNRFEYYNGTSWVAFVAGGGGSQNLQQTTDLGATTDNPITISNNSSTASITVNDTGLNRSSYLSYDRLLFSRDGFNFNLQTPTLLGNYTLMYPQLTANDTIALKSDLIGGVADNSDWMNYTGSKLGGNLSVNFGDYDNSGNGFKASLLQGSKSFTITSTAGLSEHILNFNTSGGLVVSGDYNSDTNYTTISKRGFQYSTNHSGNPGTTELFFEQPDAGVTSTITVPKNKSGTIAFLSDIGGGVDLTANYSWTGTHDFTNPLMVSNGSFFADIAPTYMKVRDIVSTDEVRLESDRIVFDNDNEVNIIQGANTKDIDITLPIDDYDFNNSFQFHPSSQYKEPVFVGTQATFDSTFPSGRPEGSVSFITDLPNSGNGSSIPLEKEVLNHSYTNDGNRNYEVWNEKINIALGGETISGEVVNTFRIPTCVFATNGDLLVASEGRLTDSADDSDAGIFLFRLRENTILEKTLLVDKPIGGNKATIPNFVKNGSRVYMFYNTIDVDGTPTVTNEIKLFYTYSDDNGENWNTPIEYLASDQDAVSSFKYFSAPGNSIVHSNGDIIIPIWGKYVAGTSPTWFRSGIIVWDGTTFTKRLLDSVDSINEPTIYEDENGDIVMSCRTGSTGANNRVVYRTSDFGANWIVDASSGASSFSVYTNIQKFGNELYRLEIDDGAISSQRKNLNLYKTDLSNTGYNKVLDITERESEIWGYGAMDNYLNRFVVVSEDKPDLNLYNVFVEDKGVLNIYKNVETTPSYPAVDFYASLLTNGDDTIVPLTPTNGGNVTYSEGAVFDGTDNSYLEYPDNDVFDFGGSPNGDSFYMSFNLMKTTSTSNAMLFMNKNGDAGTNRTWDLRFDSGKISLIVYSELTSTTPNIKYTNDQIISQNTWYHVLITEDGTGNPLVYIDNVLAGSLTLSSGTFVSMGDSSNNVVLGRYKNSSSLNFEGKINKWSIGKAIPSATERANLYNRDKMN